MDVADRLVDECGLLKSPSEGTMKKFAKLAREIQSGTGCTTDQAGTLAAKEIFSSEYRSNPRAGAMESILADIERLQSPCRVEAA